MVEKKSGGFEESVDREEVQALRHEYSQQGLTKKDVADDPVEQFGSWFRQALNVNLPDANAMTLATATAGGKPSARTVLLKGFDATGFRFYTNYKSRKARELEENPAAALCFLWSGLERQVRSEGRVERLPHEESAEYFAKRPRASQLGAWASHQSSAISSRRALEDNLTAVKKRFRDEMVPLPDFWGGYVLVPDAIEFWQGRPGRLHDRILYERTDDNAQWSIRRLAP